MARRRGVAGQFAAIFLLALLLGACPGPPSAAPDPSPGASPGAVPPAVEPAGVARIAYPEEPGAWYAPLTGEPAAEDLAGLWGLPLYRIDQHGQLRASLAASAEVGEEGPDGSWQVTVVLREGSWSDGVPVSSADVVATLEALRGAGEGRGLEPLVSVEAAGERAVVLSFDRPYGRWPYLLAGGTGVLPAHVLAQGGIEAFRHELPVSGGPFHLVEHVPGLRAVFAANPANALGPPGLERVEVWFTASYDTALGLLDQGRVDVVLGHLALAPVERALEVDGVEAAAPLGGTWVLLRWQDDGVLGADGAVGARRSVRDGTSLDALVEALLGEHGEPATATVPGVSGPWASSRFTPRERVEGVAQVTLLVPRGQEVVGLTSRTLQRSLRSAGIASVTLVRREPDELAARAGDADAVLLVRRDTPRPSLLARAPAGATEEALAGLLAADAAGRADDLEVVVAQNALHDEAFELPLYRVGAAHAWRGELEGVRPSSWPGLALWDVGTWRWGPDGPPPQAPTMEGR